MDDIKKAVSIVIICGKEIFTIVRQNHLRAFPGYTSFPGGKLEKEDMAEDDNTSLMNAVKREAREELGIPQDIAICSSSRRFWYLLNLFEY